MIGATHIYLVLNEEGYEFCRPVQNGGFQTVNREVNGSPRSALWPVMPVRIVSQDCGRELQHSDAPWWESHALVFRPRATEALETILAEHGELLPLAAEGAALAMLNVLRVVDALDEARSDVARFDDGRVMGIYRYVFDCGRIGDAAMFKIPNRSVSPTFVTQRFVDAWRSAHLVGLDFKLLQES